MTDASTRTSRLSDDAPIAAFDVDGTLTWCDSFVLFLRHVAGTAGFAARMLSAAPALLAYRLGMSDRDASKEAVVGAFLGGMDRSRYTALCESFAREVYPLILRADGLARLESHREAGHRVVLVSASLEDYLLPLARQIGADEVLATRVSVTGDLLTGALSGPNCWGPQKEARLRQAFPKARIIAAYGDTRGDTEMLAAARANGGEGHLCAFTTVPADRSAVLRQLWLARRGEASA